MGAHTRQKRPKRCSAGARRRRCHRGWGGRAPRTVPGAARAPHSAAPFSVRGPQGQRAFVRDPRVGRGCAGSTPPVYRKGRGGTGVGGGTTSPRVTPQVTRALRTGERRWGDSPGAGPSPRFPGPRPPPPGPPHARGLRAARLSALPAPTGARAGTPAAPTVQARAVHGGLEQRQHQQRAQDQGGPGAARADSHCSEGRTPASRSPTSVRGAPERPLRTAARCAPLPPPAPKCPNRAREPSRGSGRGGAGWGRGRLGAGPRDPAGRLGSPRRSRGFLSSRKRPSCRRAAAPRGPPGPCASRGPEGSLRSARARAGREGAALAWAAPRRGREPRTVPSGDPAERGGAAPSPRSDARGRRPGSGPAVPRCEARPPGGAPGEDLSYPGSDTSQRTFRRKAWGARGGLFRQVRRGLRGRGDALPSTGSSCVGATSPRASYLAVFPARWTRGNAVCA